MISGWDHTEVVPPEMARCDVPGWLWGDNDPSPDGCLLRKHPSKIANAIIRQTFLDKMEQLEPGYFKDVSRAQNMHLGMLCRIASRGINMSDPDDVDFYQRARAAIAEQKNIHN